MPAALHRGFATKNVGAVSVKRLLSPLENSSFSVPSVFNYSPAQVGFLYEKTPLVCRNLPTFANKRGQVDTFADF